MNPPIFANTSPPLPIEIWLLILENLPGLFFQADLSRLTLSRQWYNLAYPIYLTRIAYHPRAISNLINRKTRGMHKVRHQLIKSLRSLDIVLPPTLPDTTSIYNTESNLLRLSLLLLQCPELRTLSITTLPPAHPWLPNILPLNMIHPCLALPTLTTLDLDLVGATTMRYNLPEHLCPHLPHLLSRLHTFKLRARCLCKDAFRLQDDQVLSVKTLSVDLFLGDVAEHNPKLNMTRKCGEKRWETWVSPNAELREALKKVKARVGDGRVEMAHLAPSGEVHVWEAGKDECFVTGRRRRVFPIFGELEAGGCFEVVQNEEMRDEVTGDELIV
ncbi:hypothetical protein OQA88_12401 [Cercophora sp. LCS_1]